MPRDRRDISLRDVFRANKTPCLYGLLRETSSRRLVDAIRATARDRTSVAHESLAAVAATVR